MVESLKKQLAGAAEVGIDARTERVVIDVDAKALFDGDEVDPGLTGFRVLFRLGKALKGMKDRQIIVTAETRELKKLRKGPSTSWHLSAARAVSVAQFLVKDGGLDARNISTSAPSPGHARGRADHVRIVLAQAEPTATRS